MRYPHYLLAIIFLGSLGCAPKKDVYGPEQRKRIEEYRKQRQEVLSIDGFWQEYSRTEIRKRMAERALEFTDTLKIVFRNDSLTRFYDMQGRISSGRLTYKDGLYHLGNGQSFATLQRLGDTLRLANENNFTYLRKVRGFYTKPVGPERTDIPGEVEKLDISLLKGKWKVYKKEDKNFSRKKTYLHSFVVKESHADGTFEALGYYQNAEVLKKHYGFLAIKQNVLRMHMQKQEPQEYKILQANKGEIVLKQGEVVYYLTNLSK